MDKDIAIKVERLSKTFRIPHEKVSSLRGAFVGMFRGKRTFEEFQALDDVSFEVKKGEFFGIIGRNGSGKSTLLKILAGIYQPDKGKVTVNGMISPFLELGIGFNPELSGRDNVYLNATVLGLTKKQIDKKFNDIVAFSELERFIDQKLKNYSSGMQVRLAFSVAIHANRDILLMDEVLAVGDSNFQSKCLEEFSKYREMGRTVILVSHDISTIQRYCDRAMLLRNGKVIKVGKADDVGAEYMYQNIDDEEERSMNEQKSKFSQEEKNLEKLQGKDLVQERERIELEKRKHEEERRNKVADIVRVEFLDGSGKARSVFEVGDDIMVRVYFEIFKMKEEFNFGLALHNQEGNYVLGINTIFDKIDTKEAIKKGFFQVNFTAIPLNGNSYFALASIVKDDFNTPYALLLRSQSFRVVSKNQNQGIVAMDYRWV